MQEKLEKHTYIVVNLSTDSTQRDLDLDLDLGLVLFALHNWGFT